MWFDAYPSPLVLALLAGTGTWLVTALGAAAVFFFSKENERLMTSFHSLPLTAVFGLVDILAC